MSSMLDTLFSIFKGANPEASDEDIKAHLASMQASPDQMKDALTSLSPSADTMPMNIPSANSVPSSFDVGVSDNTVTQNGSAPSVTSAPAEVPPPPPPTPVAPPTSAPVAPPVPAPEAAPAPTSAPAKPDANVSAMLSKPSDDSDAEAALVEKNRKAKMAGAISGIAGGIGDAISSAAPAFGGKATTGTQDDIMNRANAQVEQNKTDFEEKEKKDPTSSLSQHYQKVLGLILGDKAKGFNLSGMSAEQIASTLPEVEKYMQKELGLAQIKSNKDLQLSMHEQGRQDKLEKDAREWVDNLSKARNGEIGVQNAKVDQARHLLQAYKQAEDSGKPFSNATYNEIAVGLANLMSSNGNVDAQTRHNIAQATLQGGLNKALTYIGLDPTTLGGTTEAVAKNLKDSIIRQGLEAEKQRDKFINDQKQFIPSGLNPAAADKLVKANFGNSIKDLLPQNQPTSVSTKASAPEGTVKSIGNRNFTVINGMWHEIGQ